MDDLSQRTWDCDLTISPSGQKHRIRSTPCFGPYSLFAEPVAAGEQVAVRDHLSYRPMSPGRGYHRYRTNRPTDPHMPVLARVYHFDTRKLDADIQRERELDGVESTTGQVSASANSSRHSPDYGKPRILRPNNTPYSKLRNPGHRLHFNRR